MRHRGRVDKTQNEIVMALRQVGAKVAITSNLGDGFPDLLVAYRDNILLMEVKSRGGRLTQDEESFYSEWRPYMVVVYTVDEALKAIGAI